MTDIDRELDQLIEGARAVDQPASREADRVWATLAAGTLASAATLTTAGTASAAAGAAASTAGTSAGLGSGAGSTLLGIALWKWGLGLLVVGLAGGAVVATLPRAAEPAVVSTPPPAAPPQEQVEAKAGPAPRVVQALAVPSAEAVLSATPPTKGPAPVASRPAASDDLAAELELLRAAKLAANQGRTAEAMARLDEYDRRFPKGALRNEAYGTRAQAYCGAGDTVAARAAMSRLSPDSALSHRLEVNCK